jgi:hemolysin III
LHIGGINQLMGGLLRKPLLSAHEPEKPLLRGQFHHVAFYVHLLLGIVVLSFTKNALSQFAFFVYILCLLFLYGTSATFHTTSWKDPKAELLVQKMDHASIFLVISGTYTAVCMICLPFEKPWVQNMLLAVWATAVVGIIKTIFWHDPPVVFNVGFYFFTGLIIIPFMPLIVSSVEPSFTISCAAGGACYLVGGVIYGCQKPDPYPKVFGYHEIFHVLTLIANTCFLYPIIVKILE